MIPYSELVKKKPIVPSEKELNENIPSRSAKLRYMIKKDNFYQLRNRYKKKFQHLIDIENFGKKL